MNVLARAESRRQKVLGSLDGTHQAELGQFFTPLPVSQIMASMPVLPGGGHLRILDPGAGSGVLTAALVERIHRDLPGTRISVTAVEKDPALLDPLGATLADCRKAGARTNLVHEDFVTWALRTHERFDLVIQNPPYRKLRSGSGTDTELRKAGITVPNIYSAFMALGCSLLDNGGQQVSITPRSWMNGPYYRTFRHNFLDRLHIDSIHTFESRSKVFGDMGVLQESVIVCGTAGSNTGPVVLRSSHDHKDAFSERQVPYEHVVTSDFVFIPASEHDSAAVSWMGCAKHTLTDLGFTVSTGKVVDFRSRDLLDQEPGHSHVPMIYPANIRGFKITHPVADLRKPQWFRTDTATAMKLLIPPGSYVLVKRFSAKEERRRIVAAVWTGDQPTAFDNKVNYIHDGGNGMDPILARGLEIWLNSKQVDDYFRVFSGHTQVNATEIQQMRFPSKKQLIELASYPAETDDAVEKVVGQNDATAA